MTRLGEPPRRADLVAGWPVELIRSVVQVLDTAGHPAGTGFVVGPGLLVTCAHILTGHDRDEPVTVVFTHLDGATRTAQLDPQCWRGPEGADVAFLRVAEPLPAPAQPLALGGSPGVGGHRVKTFGFPVNAPSAGHYGYGVAGDQIEGDGGTPLLQLTDCTEVTEGFSGGPVLDECTGLVIGMVNSISSPDPHGRGRATAYVTPTETLRAVCAELTVTQLRPYRGLEPFSIADAAWFYGRDRAVRTVLASLRREQRLLALLGPSGAGKSSLLHAGVLPALAGGALPGSEGWGWLSIRPGADPFAALDHAGLTGSATGLGPAASRWLDQHPEHDRLLLVVDQCEELLVATPPALRTAFLTHLTVVAEQEPAVTVIVGLRDDFYGRLAAAAPGVMRLVEQALVNIPAVLDAEELAAIIDQPAAVAGLTLEPELAERIVSDTVTAAPALVTSAGGAAITVLPLLEFTLTEVWHRRSEGRLTHRAYEQIGGVVGGLARWCDQAYRELPAAQRPLVRQIVTSLVRPGDEAANIPPTRQRRTRDQLRVQAAGTPQGEVDAVIAALADRRLLVTSRDAINGEPVVELVHETLIREWGWLRQWLSEDHEFLAWRGDLETAHAHWAAPAAGHADRDPELLLRGSALEQARSWLDKRPGELRPELAEFIRLSEDTQHQRLTRDRRRVRLLAVLLAVAVALAAVASILGVYSASQANQARQATRLATSRALAAQATTQAGSDVGQLLSLESLHTAATPEAWASLQATLSQPLHPSHQLLGHTSPVYGVAFSPDGKLLATASVDRSVRLWDVATHQPLGQPLVGHTNWIYGVAFSPDGTLLATASVDRSVRLWDVATHQPLGQPLVGHTGAVYGVAFSPDGTLLASAGEDHTVRLWGVASRQPVGQPFVGHTEAVWAVAFSPDGRLLASASADDTVRLWDVVSRQPVGQPLVGHTYTVYGVAFSPDGRLLATVSQDKTVRLWDVATHQPVGEPLTGHAGTVTWVAFSPDGTLLATASFDRSVRLWDVASRQSVGQPLVGHADWVFGVAFSPDGRLLASASADRTVRLWDVATRQPVGQPLSGHSGAVGGVAFSPDGRLLASASADDTVRLWDVATRQPVGQPLSGHTDAVWGVAFSPDGRLLATVSQDKTVRLWDVATHQPVGQPLVGHADAVYGVAFSPDGTLLATTSLDDTVRLWDVATHQLLGQPLSGHTGWVWGVAFSPDGRLLATAGQDGTGPLWDVASRQPLGAPLTGHLDPVAGVAFSPDGRLLATASYDDMVRLWDVASRQPVGQPLTGHTDAVYRVAFSPDGTLLASASQDGTVRLWAAPATWVRQACELVGRNLSQEEWDRYVGAGIPYVRQCAQYPSGLGANPDAPVATYPPSP